MKRKRWLWIVGALLVLAVVGGWAADRQLKGLGHPGLVTFCKQWWNNYPESFAMDPPVISITVSDGDMEQLYGVVERAREAGVIEQEGNDYVKGEFRVQMPEGEEGSGEFKGKLRIKGKMTDHVEGKKWSFRVIAKKDGGFLGMKRFSLQHPGTRNYLCDWFYHQLMKGEGIVALRYGFCKVELNGEDLGVYAYEEHFGPELLEHNGRLPGPIVRFDPSLFWQHRIASYGPHGGRMEQGVDIADAYGAYQAANLDAFGTDDIAKDPEQTEYFQEAISLMEGFRTGKLAAGDVFDVQRMGKRLAILDLVGGHQSMDWSDVKFYYDPVSKKLEPISYESFSANPITELAGAYKYTRPFEESDDLHTALFKDTEIFAAYVHELERMSAKHYLDSAFTSLKGVLDTASATMYGEFPYKPLDRSIYYRNQQVIKKLLDTPKGFYAYNNGLKDDTLTLAFVPVESVPMQLDAIVLANGKKATPIGGEGIIPCRERGKVGRPVEMHFDEMTAADSVVKVEYHVLGASVKKQVDVLPFKLSVSSAQDELLAAMKPNAREFPFIVLDDETRTVLIKSGAWKLDRTLVIPAGYICKATAPLKLDIVNGGELISYSPLQWKGLEDERIVLFSSDSTSHGVHVIDAGPGSTLENIVFADLTRYAYDQSRSADVSFHASDVNMKHVMFTGSGATLLDLSVCKATLSDCRFDHGSDQLEAHFTELHLRDVAFELAGDDAISVEGGTATLEKVGVGGWDNSGIAIKGTKSAWINASELAIDNVKCAFEGREGAKLTISDARVEDVARVAEANKKEMRYGPVRIDLKKVSITNAKEQFKCGAGSTITLDGKKVGGVTAGGT